MKYSKRHRSSIIVLVLLLCALGYTSIRIHQRLQPNITTPADSDSPELGINTTPQRECMDDKILIRVGEITVAVKRKGASVRLNSGDEIEDLEHRCDLSLIDNAQAVGWENMGIADISKTQDYRSTYDQHNIEIEKAQRDGTLESLAGDVQRVNRGGAELYVLPLKLAPTADGTPVTFDCTDVEVNRDSFLTQECITNYLLLPNLRFGYRLRRAEYPDETYTMVDQQRRSDLDAAINEAKKLSNQRDQP